MGSSRSIYGGSFIRILSGEVCVYREKRPQDRSNFRMGLRYYRRPDLRSDSFSVFWMYEVRVASEMNLSTKTLVRLRDWAWRLILWIEPKINPVFAPTNRAQGVTSWKHHDADVRQAICKCGEVVIAFGKDNFYPHADFENQTRDELWDLHKGRCSVICPNCRLGHWRVA